MTQKPTPYDGTMIFKPIPNIKNIIERVEARRADKADLMAQHYAKPEFYQNYYRQAIKRLSEGDIINVAEAAKRMSITTDDYIRLAEQGEALLIVMGKRKFVPAWSIAKDGKVDALKLDIAREFVLEGNSYFKFIDYLHFMTEKKADIADNIAAETLSTIFYAAGVSAFDCRLSVNATMNQLADLKDTDSFYREALMLHLNAAVTHGGWDASGGLSRFFRNRHNIPGLTMDEERMVPRP